MRPAVRRARGRAHVDDEVVTLVLVGQRHPGLAVLHQAHVVLQHLPGDIGPSIGARRSSKERGWAPNVARK